MLKPGEHLKVSKTLYSHHGLYIGDGKVVHYAGLADGLRSGPVEVTTMDQFCDGCDVEIIEHPNRRYSFEEAVERAMLRVGEKDYHAFHNNCEHFVNWCIEGEHFSKQTFFSYPIKWIKEKQIAESVKDRQRLDEFRRRLSKFF